MNTFNLQYYKNRYSVLILVFIAIIPMAFLGFLIGTNNVFLNLFETHLVISLICFILILVSILYIIIMAGLKIVSKNIEIKLNYDYIEINSVEKIYYKDIANLKLETIKAAGYNIVTAYILTLNKNKFVVLTGTSKKEKINCETLLIFHSELEKKLKEFNS